MKHSGSGKESKDVFWLALAVFLVGMHSILLGLIIYFFTDFFYQTFFGTSVENLFFVRQSGIFLFLAGLFYLYPLLNLRNLYNLVLLVIVSKVVAVIFLITNAAFTSAALMIYLASFFDGLMAVILAVVYWRSRKAILLARRNMAGPEATAFKETS